MVSDVGWTQGLSPGAFSGQRFRDRGDTRVHHNRPNSGDIYDHRKPRPLYFVILRKLRTRILLRKLSAVRTPLATTRHVTELIILGIMI